VRTATGFCGPARLDRLLLAHRCEVLADGNKVLAVLGDRSAERLQLPRSKSLLGRQRVVEQRSNAEMQDAGGPLEPGERRRLRIRLQDLDDVVTCLGCRLFA
jgi:hypothetical protein